MAEVLQSLREGYKRVKETPLNEFFLPTSTPFKKATKNIFSPSHQKKRIKKSVEVSGFFTKQAGSRISNFGKDVGETNLGVAEDLEKKAEEDDEGPFSLRKTMAADVRLKSKVGSSILGFFGEMVKDTGESTRKVGSGEKLEFWDYLNLTDWFDVTSLGALPILKGGLKTVTRKGAKQALEEAAEKIVKEGIEEEVERVPKIFRKLKPGASTQASKGTKPTMKKVVEELGEKETREVIKGLLPKNKLNVAGGKYSLDRFNLNPQLEEILEKTAKVIEPELIRLRGGKKSMPWDEVFSNAQGDVTVAQILDWNKGDGITQEMVAAGAMHLKRIFENLDGTIKDIHRLEDSGLPTDILRAEAADSYLLAKGLMAKVFGQSTEAGRILNLHKALARELLSPRAQAEMVFLRNADKYKNIDAVVTGLLKFDPEDRVGIAKYIRSTTPFDSVDFIESMWYNNVLSGTSTHLVNQIGNTARSIWHLSTKPARVGADIVRSKMTKSPREEFISEMIPEFTGFFHGFQDGVTKGLFALEHGIRKSDIEDMTQLATQGIKAPMPGTFGAVGKFIGGGKGETVGKFFGTIWESPTRFLLVADEVMRGMNRSMDIYRSAANKAAKKGLKGDEFAQEMAKWINSPTQKTKKEAGDLATKLLFLELNNDVKSLGGLKRLGSFRIGPSPEFRPLTFVFPFVKTMTNIAKFLWEASFFGFGKSTLDLAGFSVGRAFGKEVPTDLAARELNRKLASGFYGTLAYAALATHFTAGNLTGAPPRNQKDKDAWFATGKIPYAAKIGDHWIEYNRIEPFNFWLAKAALMHDRHQDGKFVMPDMIDLVAMGNNFMESSFLQGFNDMNKAFTNPDSYASAFLENRVAGGIPFSSFTGSVARAKDRTVRDPENIVQALKTRIPGLSEQVPAKKSEFEESGEATRKPRGFWEFLPTKVSSEVQNTPAEKRLRQSELIKVGKKDVLERLRETNTYKKADKQEQESLEAGVIQSFSRQVRDGELKSADKYSVRTYLRNRKQRQGDRKQLLQLRPQRQLRQTM